MAGQTPGRKQWRVFREPIENIQSLGLAEDGCPESQVILAKHLLEQNSDDGGNGEEKARLGVYWLMKASEKGHEEATRILRECLQSGRGISERNVDDVRACLNMTQGEKVSREAARELFSRLSQGEDFVTSSQIIEEMRRCSRESSSTDSESGYSGRVGDGERREEVDRRREKVTEEMLVSAASNHSRGQLPLVVKLCGPSPPSPLALHLACLPLLPPPYLFCLLLSLLGLDAVLDAAPVLLYYASLFAMLLTTSQVLAKKWEFDQFRQWSNLLVAWGCPESSSASAEWQHCWANARPCFLFLLALTLNLLVTPFARSVLYSEVAVLSTLMSLLVLYNFAWYKKKFDFLILVSFVVHLLARYPYEIDTVVSQYWRYLDVHTPTFASFIVGNSIEFCLNFRVLFYLMMPVIFVKLAGRDRWLGIFTVLLPHLVSLSWWQNAVLASNGVTEYGLIRGCLAATGVLLFLPLAGLTAVIIPVGALARFVTTQQVSPALALAAAAFIVLVYMATKARRAVKLCSFIQMALCVVSLWLALSCGESDPTSELGLDWREYSETCRQGRLQEEEACGSLVGVRVSWEGRFVSARISSLHNPLSSLVQRLPQGIGKVVTCMFGERYNHSSAPSPSLLDVCHLANWNRYEYEMEVEVGDRADAWRDEGHTTGRALLRGGQRVRDLALSLHPGERLWLSALLLRPSPSAPLLSLISAHSLSSIPTPTVSSSLSSPLLTLKPIFNFVFNPVAILR